MGWLFPYYVYTQKELKDQLRKENAELLIADRSVGNHFYMLLKRPRGGDSFIVQFMLAQDRGTWGYKEVVETMGPVRATCPDSLLDMADEPRNEYARRWREACRKHNKYKREHRRMVRAIKVGDTLQLKRGCSPPTVKAGRSGSSRRPRRAELP